MTLPVVPAGIHTSSPGPSSPPNSLRCTLAGLARLARLAHPAQTGGCQHHQHHHLIPPCPSGGHSQQTVPGCNASLHQTPRLLTDSPAHLTYGTAARKTRQGHCSRPPHPPPPPITNTGHLSLAHPRAAHSTTHASQEQSVARQRSAVSIYCTGQMTSQVLVTVPSLACRTIGLTTEATTATCDPPLPSR